MEIEINPTQCDKSMVSRTLKGCYSCFIVIHSHKAMRVSCAQIIDFRKSVIIRLQSFFYLVRLAVPFAVPFIVTILVGQVRP
jgi:hypothetical protein